MIRKFVAVFLFFAVSITGFQIVSFSQEATVVNKEIRYSIADTGVNDEGYSEPKKAYIPFKYLPSSAGHHWRAYFKFNISGIKADDINRVFFAMYFYDAEEFNTLLEARMFETSTEWTEDELTWDTQPDIGAAIGKATGYKNEYTAADVTEYIKKAIVNGEKEVAFMIEGSSSKPQTAYISSREETNDKKKPRLEIDFGNPDNYPIYDNYQIPDYGKGVDPIANAQKALSESTAEYGYEKTITESYVATDSVSVIDSDDSRFYNEDSMQIYWYSPSYKKNQKSYIKFNIKELLKSVGGAYVQLYCTNVTASASNPRKILLREALSDEWNGEMVTHVTAPQTGEVISEAYIKAKNEYVKFDVTNYLNKKLAKGATEISFVIDAFDSYKTAFSTKNAVGREPKLFILGNGEQAGSKRPVFKDHSGQYDRTVYARTNEAKVMTARPTRTLSSLIDFTVQEEVSLSKYGGRLDKRIDEGTGFFRMEKIDDRWWLVDPEGYLFYSYGKCSMRPADTQAAYDEIVKSYKNANGTWDMTDIYTRWAIDQRKILKDYGFNSLGGWSLLFRDIDEKGNLASGIKYQALSTIENENPMPFGAIIPYGVSVSYADTIGGSTGSGVVTFKGGVIPVFNPDFEEKCHEIIKTHAEPLKDCPWIIGWWSDNEINEGITMLDSALSLDPENELYVYTHAAAWEWLRNRTGRRDACIYDVNDTLREEFLEFVYDRYYRIMSEGFKKYAPNHLYLGNRHLKGTSDRPSIFKAAERYCDALSINLYHQWTPDVVDRWVEYANLPVIISEWYASVGTAAGGWVVDSWADSGKFYQNFALRLLEAKNVVGFHYFSQVADKNQTEKITELNQKIYNLIDYFDE